MFDNGVWEILAWRRWHGWAWCETVILAEVGYGAFISALTVELAGVALVRYAIDQVLGTGKGTDERRAEGVDMTSRQVLPTPTMGLSSIR